MRAQTTSWRPLARSSSTSDAILPWPMRQVDESFMRMSGSSVSASNPIGFRAHSRPLTPEQRAFVAGYTPRGSTDGLARAFGLGPDAPYSPRKHARPLFKPQNSPPRTSTPIMAVNGEKWTSRIVDELHGSGSQRQLGYDTGSGWDGRTYGGIMKVEQRTSVAAARATRMRPEDLPKMLQSRKDGWGGCGGRHWGEWQVRTVGAPARLGTWI